MYVYLEMGTIMFGLFLFRSSLLALNTNKHMIAISTPKIQSTLNQTHAEKTDIESRKSTVIIRKESRLES